MWAREDSDGQLQRALAALACDADAEVVRALDAAWVARHRPPVLRLPNVRDYICAHARPRARDGAEGAGEGEGEGDDEEDEEEDEGEEGEGREEAGSSGNGEGEEAEEDAAAAGDGGGSGALLPAELPATGM